MALDRAISATTPPHVSWTTVPKSVPQQSIFSFRLLFRVPGAFSSRASSSSQASWSSSLIVKQNSTKYSIWVNYLYL